MREPLELSSILAPHFGRHELGAVIGGTGSSKTFLTKLAALRLQAMQPEYRPFVLSGTPEEWVGLKVSGVIHSVGALDGEAAWDKQMSKSLYVGNLPWSVTDESLAETFREHATVEVISARVIADRDAGRSRGFGFVEVPDDQMDAAIEALNGAEVDERTLVVNEARPRRER